jgi:hypothetical protein
MGGIGVPDKPILAAIDPGIRTCGLALHMAMLRPLRSNIATSLPPSPITAISARGTAKRFAISDNALPLLACGWVMSR